LDGSVACGDGFGGCKIDTFALTCFVVLAAALVGKSGGGARNGAWDGTGTGAGRNDFDRTRTDLRDQESKRTATIPAKQSSRNEANRAATLKSPFPRYIGD